MALVSPAGPFVSSTPHTSALWGVSGHRDHSGQSAWTWPWAFPQGVPDLWAPLQTVGTQRKWEPDMVRARGWV